jgi:hypothetical protein
MTTNLKLLFKKNEINKNRFKKIIIKSNFIFDFNYLFRMLYYFKKIFL